MHFLQESLLTLSYLFVKNILFIIVVGNVLIVCFSLSFGNLWFKVYIRRFCKTDLLSGIKRTVLCLSQSGTVIVVLIGTSSAAELAAFEDTRVIRWRHQQAAWVAVTESWWDKRQRPTEIRSEEHRSPSEKSFVWSLQSSRVDWYVLSQHARQLYFLLRWRNSSICCDF